MKDSSGRNHAEATDEPRYDQRLVSLFRATGGWRARKEVGELLERIRSSFSAATAYEDIRDWKSMLHEINEGLDDAEKLKKRMEDLANAQDQP
jgi:hypothetical protein